MRKLFATGGGVRASVLLLLLAGLHPQVIRADDHHSRSMKRWGGSVDERIAGQAALEQVLWRHRIWPAENHSSKPSLREVLPDAALRARVEDALRKSKALEQLGHPITHAQLQGEIDRMARNSKDPAMLSELWSALGNDADRIAECMARPILADRILRNVHSAQDDVEVPSVNRSFDDWWSESRNAFAPDAAAPEGPFTLPQLTASSCAPNTWMEMDPDLPAPVFQHSAVWTGTEMIVWGGADQTYVLGNTRGSRYDPSTDTWSRISRIGEPAPRQAHTAVWTGSRMIVWGGVDASGIGISSGGVYDPATNSWSPMSATGAPTGRFQHTAIWTGSLMIVWGGTHDGSNALSGGARYDPSTNSWTAVTTTGAPSARALHTAVWTGSEMVVWGGTNFTTGLNSGGAYKASNNSWTATREDTAPTPRSRHTAVWTGSQMIIWGGFDGSLFLADGARYTPTNNQWTVLPSAGAPTARALHSAAWSGTDMVVWGGTDESVVLSDGGRYRLSTNTWSPLPASGLSGRFDSTTIWTGSEMIVWGGYEHYAPTDSGARYNPASNNWTPTAASSRPIVRVLHSAIWTGSEMIIWGGTTQNWQGSDSLGGASYLPATDAWTPISGVGRPSAREEHSAIWTGTEMIVWGGASAQSVPVTGGGGRYSPALDAWSSTTSVAEPAPRFRHTAVWTGTRMVVWGGEDGFLNPKRNGGVYDPSLDVWTPTTLANAPAEKRGHTAVWSGSEMVVWGGSGPDPNSGSRYDPVSDVWTPISTANAPPGFNAQSTLAASVWTGNKMLVLSAQPNQSAIAGLYDPALDAWTPIAGTSPSNATWGVDWLCGGPAARYRTYDPILRLYDSVANSWSSAAIPEVMAGWIGPTVSTGNQLILWGGWQDNNRGSVYCGCASTPPPGFVSQLRLSKLPERLSWYAMPGVTVYDVIRGSLADLRSSHGDFTIATDVCVASGAVLTTLDDPAAAPAGGFWYLVRAKTDAVAGSYDSGSGSQVGSRDAEIAASGAACP